MTEKEGGLTFRRTANFDSWLAKLEGYMFTKGLEAGQKKWFTLVRFLDEMTLSELKTLEQVYDVEHPPPAPPSANAEAAVATAAIAALNEHYLAKYVHVTKALANNFAKVRGAVKSAELDKMQQGDLNIEEWADRVSLYASMAIPPPSSADQTALAAHEVRVQEKKKTVFVLGLRHAKTKGLCQHYMRKHNDCDFNDLKTYAFDTFSKYQCGATDSTDAAIVGETVPVNSLMCVGCGKEDHMLVDCPMCSFGFQQQPNQTSGQSDRGRGRGDATRGRGFGNQTQNYQSNQGGQNRGRGQDRGRGRGRGPGRGRGRGNWNNNRNWNDNRNWNNNNRNWNNNWNNNNWNNNRGYQNNNQNNQGGSRNQGNRTDQRQPVGNNNDRNYNPRWQNNRNNNNNYQGNNRGNNQRQDQGGGPDGPQPYF